MKLLPFSNSLLAGNFTQPAWNDFVGEHGGYTAESMDGTLEAIAEPIANGFRLWLVRTSNGETIYTRDLCAS